MNSLKTKSGAKKRIAKKLPAASSLKALVLKGPVMSESQFQSFIKTREQFEVWKGK